MTHHEHPLMHREREAHGVNDAERIAMRRIQALLHKHPATHLGSGRSADVVLPSFAAKDDTRVPWVIKQERRRTREQELMGVTLETELVVHDVAYNVLANAIEREPDKAFARIPRPLSTFVIEKDAWLIMEYIPGETLLERTMRQILLAYADDADRLSIEAMRRDELSALLLSDEYRHILPARMMEEYYAGALDLIQEQHFRMLAVTANQQGIRKHCRNKISL